MRLAWSALTGDISALGFVSLGFVSLGFVIKAIENQTKTP
jgi:hypothetical protein